MRATADKEKASKDRETTPLFPPLAKSDGRSNTERRAVHLQLNTVLMRLHRLVLEN